MTEEKKFVMEQEFEDVKKGFKAGVKKHWKKGVVITGGIVMAVIGVKAGYKHVTSGKDITDLDIIPEPNAVEDAPMELGVRHLVDQGRDCIMKFFVKETDEELGSGRCTEAFAKDAIERTKEGRKLGLLEYK